MKLSYLTTILLIFSLTLTFANDKSGSNIKGKISDEKTESPLQYANIVLFNKSDSIQIAGTVADDGGTFILEQLPEGKYYAKASFIGYQPKLIEDIFVNSNGNTVDLGEIFLLPDVYDMDDVIVRAERAAVSYEIDKKVINVDKQFTAVGGTATDVLENVPSVTVDIEGNVSLRGSSNFQVLVDGRPTILDANEILQQTPASSLKNIEIITNPSAKYDPEGAAGIINLVLKQKEDKGFSALLELDGGLNDKYSSNVISEYKTESMLLNFGVDFRDQVYLWDRTNESRTTLNGLNSYINSNGDGTWGRKNLGLRGGATFFLSDATSLIFGARYRDGGFEQSSSNNFFNWSDVNPAVDSYISQMDRERKGDRLSLNTTLDHKFSESGHKIILDLQYRTREGNEITTNRLLDFVSGSNSQREIISGQRSTEKGPSIDINTKLDYTLPLGNKHKFEAGFQADLDDSDDNTGLYEYDLQLRDYVFQPEFSNSVNYKKNIYSSYITYGGEINKFGFQAGFRTELTDRKIELTEASQEFKLNRWDYFPTAHISYKLGGGNQLMASYTKRINRPRGWNLEPFETFLDAYNVRKGNPSLSPEYIDSYELGYQTMLGRNIISAEAYYKVKDNVIERVRTAYADNVTLQTSENVGMDYSFGSELMFNFDAMNNWNVNLMGNLYHYKIEGSLYGEDFSRDSFNWNARFNNNIKFDDILQLQFNAMYNSSSVSAQGRREGFFMVNAAVKKDFFDKVLAVTLQFRNLLGTANWESIYESPSFYSYSLTEREAPMVTLNLRYNFNMKPKQNGNRGGGMFGDGGDF